MMYRCRTLSAPLRSEAKHSSEMVSELLYGEYMTATGQHTELWIEVQCEWDDYVGWVSRGQVEQVPAFDASLHMVALGAPTELYPGSMTAEELQGLPPSLEIFKATYLETPYYWGGRSTQGIDCSGLAQLYYKLRSVRIPRDASAQALCGESLESLEECLQGDLAFFSGSSGRINHVGILTGDGHILHATETQGRVVHDHITAEGIINSETGKLSHPLASVVRIFFDAEHLG